MKHPTPEKPSADEIRDHVYAAVAQGKLQAPLPGNLDLDQVARVLAADHHGRHDHASFDAVILEELNLIARLATATIHGEDAMKVYPSPQTPGVVIESSWIRLSNELTKFGVVKGEITANTYFRELKTTARAFVQQHYPQFQAKDGPL